MVSNTYILSFISCFLKSTLCTDFDQVMNIHKINKTPNGIRWDGGQIEVGIEQVSPVRSGLDETKRDQGQAERLKEQFPNNFWVLLTFHQAQLDRKLRKLSKYDDVKENKHSLCKNGLAQNSLNRKGKISLVFGEHLMDSDRICIYIRTVNVKSLIWYFLLYTLNIFIVSKLCCSLFWGTYFFLT